MTYATTGNVVAVTAPSSEWVAQGGVATGIFPAQVTVGSSRSDFVSDNRPSTITAPTTITGSYSNQYLVTYLASGNIVTVTVPANEWVTSGNAAVGSLRCRLRMVLAIQEATLSVIIDLQRSLRLQLSLAPTATSTW